MAQLSSSDVFGDIRVRGQVISNEDIVEKGETLELKYSTKTEVESLLSIKADITYVDKELDKKETPANAQLKANKALAESNTYTDNKVKTNVPTGAKFTDTITTINGKTGSILKSDIEALGISAVGPKGDKGDKGDTGARGPQGLKGDTGDTGPRGPEGLKGATGEKGDTGAKGDTGLRGPEGAQGIQGLKGDVGVRGPEGPQGPQGLKGDTGARGPQGLKGDTGAKGDAGTEANVTKINVEKALGHSVNKSVPANAVFTDTTYQAGDNITIENNTISSKSSGLGLFGFEIVNGDLYVEYNDNEKVPDFEMTADGELILII